jgi:hypothetical protein
MIGMLTMLLGVGHAQDAAALEKARRDAEASIREGEAHQLRSKYWQTFRGKGFTAVVPSYAEPTVAGATWSLDLAGPYVLRMIRVTGEPDAEALARLKVHGGEQAVADRPGGRVYDVQTAAKHLRVAGRTLGSQGFVIEVEAPRGELDGAIADRVLAGVTP